MACRRWMPAVLLLVASVAALRSPHYSLWEGPPSNCGFTHYGSAAGSAQRLVETHLAPGVADWNIVVPITPPCVEAQVTGVDMRVCDADAPPDVDMSDAQSARVHRAGQLTGFATVNVTVYCILPRPPPPLPPPPTTTRIALPLSHLTDSRSAYEMLSYELSSKEVTSNEVTSYELESTVLQSIELAPTVKPSSSTTFPPTQEETTAQVELTPSTEVVTAPSNNTTRPKEKTPNSLKVTINITPTNQISTEKDVSESYGDGVELPLLLNKEKPNEVMSSFRPRFSSVPYIMTPPRISAMPPWNHVKQPRGPGSPHRPPGGHQQQSAYWLYGAHRPPPHPLLRPPHYSHGSQYSAMLSPYDLMPPYSVAPVYRQLSLLSPRLTFLQRRQPLLFFRHF